MTGLVPGQRVLRAQDAAADGEPSFLGDVAPVFVSQCQACHNAQRRAAGLALDRFAGLSDGGNSGSICEPGKPEESLLIQKLRGTAPDGERMPRGRPPLDEATIGRIAEWMRRGAAFDGSDPQTPLEVLLRAYQGQKLSAGDLDRQRAELAAEHWRLAAPDEKPGQVPSDHFLLWGNVSEKQLVDLSGAAETIWDKLPATLRLDGDEVPLKGRATLFVFRRRFDYAEFCRMAEKHEPIEGRLAHWHFDGLDAYACLVEATGEPTAQETGRLAEALTGLLVSSWGQYPEWFTAGVGRWVATRLTPRHPGARQWSQQAAALLAAQEKPEEIWNSALAPGEGEAIGYALVAALAKDAPRWGRLTTALSQGQALDTALAQIYGSDVTLLTGRLARQLRPRGR